MNLDRFEQAARRAFAFLERDYALTTALSTSSSVKRQQAAAARERDERLRGPSD